MYNTNVHSVIPLQAEKPTFNYKNTQFFQLPVQIVGDIVIFLQMKIQARRIDMLCDQSLRWPISVAVKPKPIHTNVLFIYM